MFAIVLATIVKQLKAMAILEVPVGQKRGRGLRTKEANLVSMPYLEIRSRDCLDGLFNAKILMYGVNFSKNPNGTEVLREKIHPMESNGVFKTNYGEKRNKQVGRTPKGRFSQNSVDGFIDNVRTVVKEYLEAVSIWNL